MRVGAVDAARATKAPARVDILIDSRISPHVRSSNSELPQSVKVRLMSHGWCPVLQRSARLYLNKGSVPAG